MIIYIARIFAVKIYNATIPSDWKKDIVVPIYKEGNHSLISNYRPVSLTSAVSRQIGHVMASYLKEIWYKKDWIFKGQHGLRSGSSRESQVITVWQDIADSLDNGGMIDDIIIGFRLSSP
jgi:hypothetical protein